MSDLRIGQGFDIHRLVPGRALLLGGVLIPHDLGLEGHSDGDCVLHSLCDALLGAAGAGDMGTHFPSTDPQWKGIASTRFVEKVGDILAAGGWSIVNVDLTLVAQAPPLAPHVPTMRKSLAGLVRLAEERISVKIKSSDHIGAIGRGEGIACFASVLLDRRPT